jgi:hypothetical protein
MDAGGRVADATTAGTDEAAAGPSAAGDDAAGDASTGAADVEGDAETDTTSGDSGTTGCVLGIFGEPTELRCTGLYANWPSRTIAGDVTEYDPGLHLWSDGAVKTRWVQLPAGQPIDTSNMDEWVFPVGTKFWKQFVLGGKLIETRLLWKQPGGWYRTTYRWTDDESNAVELIVGQQNADGNGYEVPTQLGCFPCHNGRKDIILGFEAVSLSSPGASGVTMASLIADRRITVPPTSPLVIPGDPVAAAALGYLHANCGTGCHNAGSGLANFTGFHMRLDVATLGSVEATDAWKTGMNVPTLVFPIPGVAKTYRIKACDASSSAVHYRMSHLDNVDGAGPFTQMPPFDSHKINDAGVATIEAWINEGCK